MTLPSFTLESAQEAISSALLRIRHSNVDRIDRARLEALARKLRGYLRQAEAEAASAIGSKHLFNENWLGPQLADVLADCEAILSVQTAKRRKAA